MTKGERTSDLATYDDDFFTWTQQQAAALRLTREVIGGSVDVEHVAEEIEDLGKRDLREVASFLARLFEHLLKLDACPGSQDRVHWLSETVHFQFSASAAFTPGMRQLLDVDKIWKQGCKRAAVTLRDSGTAPILSRDCPFPLGEVLSDDFDIDDALAKLKSARDTPRP